MRALILVDIQNDFLPTGVLPVADGDAIIPIVNRLQPHFDLVVATQDWHPANHGSFAANHPGRNVGDVIELGALQQILWPVHCVQHTDGAEFAPTLDRSTIRQVFQKGTDPEIDSYSGFFDNGHLRSTGLGDFLKNAGVEQAYIVGLATDYCVKFTALDAQQLGIAAVVVEDACRGVELRTGDISRAIDQLRAAGVQIARSSEVLQGGSR